MEHLNGTLGEINPTVLLASNLETEAISVSMEPGNGVVKRGTLLYRKTGVMYAPAEKANVVAASNLVVLRDDVDTSESATVATAAAAYRKGNFVAGAVKLKDGTAVDSTVDVVLRAQGITFSPMDDWSKDAVVADNDVSE